MNIQLTHDTALGVGAAATTPAAPMTTGTKVLIGVGVVAAIGGIYLLTRPSHHGQVATYEIRDSDGDILKRTRAYPNSFSKKEMRADVQRKEPNARNIKITRY
jgi:hypothetical protein